MARSTMIVVSDDYEFTEKAKTFGQAQGVTVQAYTSTEWARGMNDPAFLQKMAGHVPNLMTGNSPVDQGAKILPFPGQGSPESVGGGNKKVRTINELESIAIENAIQEYNGNLTEAAKALGIGRATLYRKVKQYNIDPSKARKRRAA